jgi:hypothetical protein
VWEMVRGEESAGARGGREALTYRAVLVQLSAVQCSAVQCSAVQCSALQCLCTQHGGPVARCTMLEHRAVKGVRIPCLGSGCSHPVCPSQLWAALHPYCTEPDSPPSPGGEPRLQRGRPGGGAALRRAAGSPGGPGAARGGPAT